MKTGLRWIALCLLGGTISTSVSAQGSVDSGRAFAVEAAGGIAGSIAGVAVGLAISRPDRCDVEDLACAIKALGVAGVGSVIGSTAGTVIAGRSIGSRPSSIGAFAGALAGALAGVGVVHALTEEVNLRLEKPVTVAVYSITQGIIAALGSRLGASLSGSR